MSAVLTLILVFLACIVVAEDHGEMNFDDPSMFGDIGGPPAPPFSSLSNMKQAEVRCEACMDVVQSVYESALRNLIDYKNLKGPKSVTTK